MKEEKHVKLLTITSGAPTAQRPILVTGDETVIAAALAALVGRIEEPDPIPAAREAA